MVEKELELLFDKYYSLSEENKEYLRTKDIEEIKKIKSMWLNWIISYFQYQDYLESIKKDDHSIEEKEEILSYEIQNYKTLRENFKELFISMKIKDFVNDYRKYWINYVYEKNTRDFSNVTIEEIKKISNKEEQIIFMFKWYKSLTEERKNLLLNTDIEILYELRNLKIWTLCYKLEIDYFIKNIEDQDKQEVIEYSFNRYYQFKDRIIDWLNKLSNKEILDLKWTPALVLENILYLKEYQNILNKKEEDRTFEEKELVLREELWRTYLLLKDENKEILRNSNLDETIRLNEEWYTKKEIIQKEIISNKKNEITYEIEKRSKTFIIHKYIDWEFEYSFWKMNLWDFNEKLVEIYFEEIIKENNWTINENTIERLLKERLWMIKDEFDINSDYLTQSKLAEIIENNIDVKCFQEFPNRNRDYELMRKYWIEKTNKKFDIAFEFNWKLFLVEFDWILHYNNINTIENDFRLRKEYSNREDIVLVEIPFFVQLDKETSKHYFWVEFNNFKYWKKDLSKYKHWFISDYAIQECLPANFIILWLKRMKYEIDNLPEKVRNDIMNSLNSIVENWIKEKKYVFSWYQWI